MSIVTTHDFYPDDVVRTTPQILSDAQKEQVRQNIGAASKLEVGTGGLTPEQVKKLAEIDDKLDKSQLQTAINQALLQAQQSGLFDGQDGQTPNLSIGTVTTLEPGAKVTASITGPTENLKLNLGIPRGKDGGAGKAGGHYSPVVTQPDPDHLKFDFAGSLPGMPQVSPVTVELPKGGGGAATPWKLIAHMDITDETASAVAFDFTVAEFPEIAKNNTLYAEWSNPTNNDTMPWTNFVVNKNGIVAHVNARSASLFALVHIAGGFARGTIKSGGNPSLAAQRRPGSGEPTGINSGEGSPWGVRCDKVASIKIESYKEFMKPGGVINIWGWNE